ncbi:MAG: UDP-3-O-acyl-N-acetylglucosamine deacetylase [Candidatus Eutrophobiaceae bacterium]
MIKQRTIKRSICSTGVGLHTGKKFNLTLRPAPPDTGVIFRRTDFSPSREIPAMINYVGDTSYCTTLSNGDASISTVEHLLSVLAGFGIDNMYIDIDGKGETVAEVPIMDGSGSSFVFLLQSAEIEEQEPAKKFLRILKEKRVEADGKWVMFKPHNGFRVTVEIDFEHPHSLFDKGNKRAEIDFAQCSYVKEVSRARTFGFVEDVEYLRSNNLALGGNLSNALVIDDHRVLNEDGLRSPNECARHKVLDAIGDLYLLGYNLIGRFDGYKTGHALNNALLNGLLSDKDAWDIVSYEEDDMPAISFLSVLSTSAMT